MSFVGSCILSCKSFLTGLNDFYGSSSFPLKTQTFKGSKLDIFGSGSNCSLYGLHVSECILGHVVYLYDIQLEFMYSHDGHFSSSHSH